MQISVRLTQRNHTYAKKIIKEREKEVAEGAASINWKPFPGSPQEMAFYSEAFECLYGGQAGGGKSSLSVGLSLCGPHHRVLILRREAAQLADLKFKIQELVASYGGGSIVRLPDRTIEVGGCQMTADWRKYKGREHSLKVFDELSEFEEAQYTSIIAWCRSGSDPCRVLATTNPPSDRQSGRWMKKRWSPWLDKKNPNPALSGEIRYFVRQPDGTEIEVETQCPVEVEGTKIVPTSRTFIRASVSDNPIMMAAGYNQTLLSLPEPLRSQLAFGDWDAGEVDEAYQVVPGNWIKAAQDRWGPTPPKGIEQPDLIAIDVARGGDDQTVIAWRYGHWVDYRKIPGKQTPDGDSVASWVIDQLVLAGIDPAGPPILVDVIGVGSSAYDSLKRLGFNAKAVNVATKSTWRDRSRKLGMVNLRAEYWWRVREDLEPSYESEIQLPPHPEVLGDLAAPHWKLVLKGIQIEKKEEIKKRIGRSPDVGDALVMVLCGRHYSPVW